MPYKPLDAKPNFPEMEVATEKFWEENNIFQKSVENREGKESFVFFEGPPTANGVPGIHHVLARAFKDAMSRFQTMRGKYVSRKAGWDTHGLAVEIQVEKTLGISGKKQIENIVEGNKYESIVKFNALCKESVWQFKDDWEKMTKRMAYWVDMSDPYVTYDPKYIESVWWLLARLQEKNLIYEGHKVVPYCPRCGTSLSSHEVAQGYDEVTEPSVFVKFKLKDEPNTFILSWTTTPWTLPGNLALAVGEDIEYAKVKVGEEIYIVAKDLAAKVLENPEITDTVKGSKLEGLSYEPLFPGAIPEDQLNDKAFKVYTADFVTTQDGTGVVHTAVMYGEDDYNLGEKVGLPKFHTVNEAGVFAESVPAVAGQFVKNKDTTEAIFNYLTENKNFLKSENYTHTYPFCWRCSTPLLYYARTSWYIRMSELRDNLIKNNEQIKWEPEHIKDGRFGEWLREVKDWAISRERYWGTPLPFWKCAECGHLKVVESMDALGKSDVDPHRPYIDQVYFTCEKCGGEQRRVPEVLDVWFDSGAMPYAQWHYPFENKDKVDGKLFGLAEKGKQFPANYICEAVDQTRGWFYTLLAISTALDLGPAFKQAISTGHIMDGKGQKMSKSKGNIVDPWEMFDTYGADAIRWYFFSVNQPGESKLFKKEDLAVTQRKVFNIVANVYNYFATYANNSGWVYEDATSPAQTKQSANPLDQWINARLQEVINVATASTDDLNIFRAVRSIEDYVNDLSTWYLRRSRNRTDDAFFATMYRNLIWLSKIMAPFAPFFAEQIYRNLWQEGSKYQPSVHLTDWPETRDLTEAERQIIEQMSQVRDAAELGNSIRKKEGVKVRQPLSAVFVSKAEAEVAWPDDLRQILLDELNIKGYVKTDEMVWHKAGDLQVDIDLRLTPELQAEGDLRELERAVQALRKEVGLNVGDPARLYVEGAADALLAKLDKQKLSIESVEVGRKEGVASQDVKLGDGSVWVGLDAMS